MSRIFRGFYDNTSQLAVNKLIHVGLVPARALVHKVLGICPSQRLRIRRQVADMLGKKKPPFLDTSLEMEHMELEHELAFAATCSWARSCWGGIWIDDMYAACKKQICNASSWNKVRGLLELSAAKLRMLSCSGQPGTPLRRESLYLNVGFLPQAKLKGSWSKSSVAQMDYEKATRSQFHWMSKDSEEWNRDPRTYGGSLREIVNKDAACGWAVAQMDPDGA